MSATVNNDASIHWHASANTDSNSIIRLGLWSVGIMMFVFLVWAVLFPLSSAVVTPGTFVSAGNNKIVQHTNGGRVQKVFVSEGESLFAGQAILELDNAQGQADLTRLQARHASLNALKLRLDAERSGGLRGMGQPSLKFKTTSLRGAPVQSASFALRGTAGKTISFGKQMSGVTTHSNKGFSGRDELVESQKDAYLSGRNLLKQEIAGLAKKAETLLRQKEGMLARADAQQSLFNMAKREYQRLKPLAIAGYVARNRLNDRERTMLELQGQVAALKMDVIGVETQIGEVRIQIRKARAENSNVASKEYTKIIGELAEISDQLVAAQSTVTGSIVRAPAAGTLLRFTATTVGGVVGAGNNIGEIVPDNTPLVVQARVLPSDIDYVHVGQEADIAVTAFNRRVDDMLQGKVVYKSADAGKDEKTGDPYFTVRLELIGVTGRGRNRLGDVQAGMQSEIYIHTGSRTFMSYLAKPMIDSFRRAFREQ
ncbi:MAG: HlyD family type I secretion periplasmic adaptor subunit [Rhizobiaceae bacterium]